MGIAEGMMIQNTTTGNNHTIVQIGDGTNTDRIVVTRGGSAGTGGHMAGTHVWTASDAWKIPIQLGGIWSMDTPVGSETPDEIMTEINNAYAAAGGSVGLNHNWDIKTHQMKLQMIMIMKW